MKLPEPVAYLYQHDEDGRQEVMLAHLDYYMGKRYHRTPLYTAGQLRAVRREALEEAAKVCYAKRIAWAKKFATPVAKNACDAGYLIALHNAEDEIRALKEKP